MFKTPIGLIGKLYRLPVIQCRGVERPGPASLPAQSRLSSFRSPGGRPGRREVWKVREGDGSEGSRSRSFMTVGNRQIVLMVHLAQNWPKRVSSRTTVNLIDPECDHAREQVVREYEGKGRSENRRTCHCWIGLDSNLSYFRRLAERGLIEEFTGDKWQLTREGWRVLATTKSTRVKVKDWDEEGWPTKYRVGKSKRPEFRVLYLENV